MVRTRPTSPLCRPRSAPPPSFAYRGAPGDTGDVVRDARARVEPLIGGSADGLVGLTGGVELELVIARSACNVAMLPKNPGRGTSAISKTRSSDLLRSHPAGVRHCLASKPQHSYVLFSRALCAQGGICYLAKAWCMCLPTPRAPHVSRSDSDC